MGINFNRQKKNSKSKQSITAKKQTHCTSSRLNEQAKESFLSLSSHSLPLKPFNSSSKLPHSVKSQAILMIILTPHKRSHSHMTDHKNLIFGSPYLPLVIREGLPPLNAGRHKRTTANRVHEIKKFSIILVL